MLFEYAGESYWREAETLHDIMDWVYIFWEMEPVEREWEYLVSLYGKCRISYHNHEFATVYIDMLTKLVTVIDD